MLVLCNVPLLFTTTGFLQRFLIRHEYAKNRALLVVISYRKTLTDYDAKGLYRILSVMLPMWRPSPLYCNEHGLSETISVIMMVILVIALAAIIGSIVFGFVVFFPKSAYIAVQTEAKNNTSGNWYLAVSHMNGDAAYLNHSLSTNEGMPVDFQFTTPGGATVIPLPNPADGPATWKPGDTLFVYNNNSYLNVTKYETLAKAGNGLPQGEWRFDVVDVTDHVIIYTENTRVGVQTPAGAPTVTWVSPPTGPTGVPNPVTITGTNLFGATSVTFGGTTATFSVTNGTSISATAPIIHAAGLVNIVVITPNGTATGTYTYFTSYPGFTVDAWVKWNIPPNPGTDNKRKWATIVVDGENDTTRRYHLQHNDVNSRFEFAVRNPNEHYLQSSTPPVANTWYYVVGVYNQTDPGNGLKLYVNGAMVNSASIGNGALKASPHRIQFGGSAGITYLNNPVSGGYQTDNRKFDGSFRGLHMHEWAIGPAEVASRFAAGLPPS